PAARSTPPTPPPRPQLPPLPPRERAGVRGRSPAARSPDAPQRPPPTRTAPPRRSSPSASRPRSRPPPENSLRPEREHQRHDHEGEHHAVRGRVGEPELLRHPDEDRPDRGPDDAPHPARDAPRWRGELVARVLARGDRQRGAPDHSGEAGEAG